jgi:GTP-binding protein
MIPKIALIGRPNVGKSALFNRIIDRRVSIVDEMEGVTRDRVYAEGDYFGRKFLAIDTGGIREGSELPFNQMVIAQSLRAIDEADLIVFVVDGQAGVNGVDEEVAKKIRGTKKPVFLAVNKIDRADDLPLIHSFHALGMGDPIGVSATQGFQIGELLEKVLGALPEKEEVAVKPGSIHVAIVGRPNVGKSTLLNQILGEERAIVSPVAGTTRDSIDVEAVVEGQSYTLIDTAGIRRKKGEKEVVDKFAAIRTEEAIERSDVCLLIFDSYEGFTTQEKRIASMIEEKGKACILLFNKWDLVKGIQMEHARRAVHEESPFLAHCPTFFLSALSGRNIEKIFPAVLEVYGDMRHRIGTGELNKFVEGCLQKYHPPMLRGKRLRIYYMTQVEEAPPKFVLFVNNPTLMVESYRKYLVNRFRETYRFAGCPIAFELRGKKRIE